MGLFDRNNDDGFEVDAVDDDAFFGTLITQVSGDTQQLGAFAELGARFTSLRSSYQGGRIDATEFGEEMSDLRVKAGDGALWTIGTTTGRWFYRYPADGKKWVVGAPPEEIGELVDRQGANTGWATDDQMSAGVDHAGFSAYTGDSAEAATYTPQPQAVTSVEDLFGVYVEEVGELPGTDGVLGVDSLDGTDSWKDRYYATRGAEPPSAPELEAGPELEVDPELEVGLEVGLEVEADLTDPQE